MNKANMYAFSHRAHIFSMLKQLKFVLFLIKNNRNKKYYDLYPNFIGKTFVGNSVHPHR